MERAAADNMGLLKTKHSAPNSANRLLPRLPLGKKLNDALNCRVTTITAPAGYGKTTAVMKWLENIPLPYAWLSIDDGDNNPAAFWRYLCASLTGIFRDIDKDTEYVFASKELLKANVHISILIERLSQADTDFICVLDDLHLIKNQEILDALSYFISYMPSNMHLLLISRTEPRLKLTRLGMKEALLRIKTKDLRFETEEIDKFFKTRGNFLNREEVQRVESYTEGWAAALVAVALSLRDGNNVRGVISGFGSSNKNIEDYLAEDVMSTWTEEQLDFMEKISVLDKLCPLLCSAVTGYDGERLLRELYERNSFLIALDEECEWFRFHHLFQDFLRKKLKKRNPALVQELHRKAGEWLEENGFLDEAMECFLLGTQYKKAAEIIDKLWFSMQVHGDYSKLFTLVSRLPDTYKTESPVPLYIEIYFHISQEDYAKAWRCIEKLERFIEISSAVSAAVRKECMMAKANLYFGQCDTENLLASLKRAAQYDENADFEYMEFNLFEISAYRSKSISTINMLRKHPADYYAMLKLYKNQIRKNPGYTPLAAGELYYETNRLNEAQKYLAAAVDEAIAAGCPGALVPAMVTLAKIRRAYGDMQGAFAIIEECESKIELYYKPHWGYLLKAFKARLYLESGETGAAESWMTESRLSLFQEITAAREYELIVLARILIAKRRYKDASLLLNRLLTFAEEKSRVHSSAELLNLLAVTAMKELDEDTALKYIEKALRIGMLEDYVRSFVDELSPMAALLELYLGKEKKTSRTAAYAKKLLSLTKENIQHSAPSIGQNAAERLLTPVENKVLQLLISACTYNEIADKLGITMSTVKSHTGSIYKKLEVKSRVQCINKVRGISE